MNPLLEPQAVKIPKEKNPAVFDPNLRFLNLTYM